MILKTFCFNYVQHKFFEVRWLGIISKELYVRVFKVVWDTLQYFQGWQDSKKIDNNHGFNIFKSITFAPKMHL